MKNTSKYTTCRLAAIILLLAMLAATLLTSCGGGTQPPAGGDETTADPALTTGGSGDTADEDFVILRGGAAVASVVRPSSAGSALTEAAVAIRRGIEQAGGILPDIKEDFLLPGDSIDPEAYEILIGNTNRPESSVGELTAAHFTEFSIDIVGRKLVIHAAEDSGYTAAATWLSNQLYSYADRTSGEIVLPADFSHLGSGTAMLATLPLYKTAAGREERLWDCGDGCRMYIMRDTNADEFKAYDADLVADGYQKYTENQIGDNLYATYTSADGKYVLNTVYTAYEKRARLIIEPMSKTDLPPIIDEYKDICGPVTVTQVGLEYLYDAGKEISEFQIGMLYIIRLRDGRFIVIDGGFDRDRGVDLFLTNIRALAPDPKNITIAAWIFTHSHGDHVGMFRRLSKLDGAKRSLSIERFVFNFPSESQYTAMKEGYPSSLYTALNAFPNAKRIKVHPGQVFRMGGAEIEFYSTIELIAPADCDTGNTVSAVFSVTAEGQKIMFLGDSSAKMTSTIVSCYGDALKSDIVQVAHHGAPGGSVELYQHIDMKVALWPLGVWDYYNFGGHGRKSESWNRYFYTSLNMKEIILAGHSVRTITLPYEPQEKNFPADREADYTP